MNFWVNLIKIDKPLAPLSQQFIFNNCIHVDGDYYLYEGSIECLEDLNIKYSHVGEKTVPSLGNLSKNELIKLCNDYYGVHCGNRN